MAEIKAKMPGKIDELKVKVGDAVKKGDIVLVIDAMKMKTPMPSPDDGTVKEIKFEQGARFSAGAVLAVIE
jgi:biotin carboxyl carrier protein